MSNKPYTKKRMACDVIMTFLFFPFWPIWLVIKYVRTH